MRGDSECSTGQPMMPTSFVAPEIVVIGSQYLPATQPCSTHNAYASHTPRCVSIVETRPIVARRSARDAEAVLASTRRRSSRGGADDGARSARARERRRSSDSVRPGASSRTGWTTAASTASTTFPCYGDAIDAIPDDLRDYTDAADVIARAFQQRDGPRSSRSRTPQGRQTEPPPANVVPVVSASSPSSVPVPLLVLAACALAVLAAGGLGYVARRRQGPDGRRLTLTAGAVSSRRSRTRATSGRTPTRSP